MHITVRDLMTFEPSAVTAETTVVDAIQQLLNSGSSEIFVVDDDNRLLGILPDYELLKAQLTGIPSELTAANLMSCQVPTTSPTQSIAILAPQLRESRYGRIAVVEDGRLLGLICRQDIMRILAVFNDLQHPEVEFDTVEPESLEVVEVAEERLVASADSRSLSDFHHRNEPPFDLPVAGDHSEIRMPQFLRHAAVLLAGTYGSRPRLSEPASAW